MEAHKQETARAALFASPLLYLLPPTFYLLPSIFLHQAEMELKPSPHPTHRDRERDTHIQKDYDTCLQYV